MINLGGIFSYVLGRKAISLASGRDEIKWNFLDLIFLWLSSREPAPNKLAIQREKHDDPNAGWSAQNVSNTGLKVMDVCACGETFSTDRGYIINSGDEVTVVSIHEDGQRVKVTRDFSGGKIVVRTDQLSLLYNMVDKHREMKAENPNFKSYLLGDYGEFNRRLAMGEDVSGFLSKPKA